MRSDAFLQEAIAEARLGLAEGGIPIGSVLVSEGRILGRGHNRRVQRGSAVLHGGYLAVGTGQALAAFPLPASPSLEGVTLAWQDRPAEVVRL